MLLSYCWLKKFVPLQVSPRKVAEAITLNLVEVESLIKKGEDTILEIENKGITNRPDCFSHLGIARELSAYFQLDLNNPLEKLAKTKISPQNNLPLEIEVKEPSLCPRYCAVVLEGLKVSPSPKWLKAGVENCGLRSINNVVDITNYVMLELGQPLHAFDWTKIQKRKIIVRRAKEEEKIMTLDGVKRRLRRTMLVIADAQRPLAIAGIMGGRESQVTFGTETIVLESANFEPINNRRTSKFLKLRTEASTRFEKGQDINLPYPAIIRAIELLQRTAGAKIASRLLDIQFKKVKPWKIQIEASWINKFLGLNLQTEEMKNILERLRLKTEIRGQLLVVTIPTFRPDLRIKADIAEEIARIYGYNKIPLSLPTERFPPPKKNPLLFWKRESKKLLTALGFSEVYTFPLVGKRLIKLANLNPKGHLQLLNPLNIEREYFRLSLLPSLLEVIKKNRRWFEEVRIFELARIYKKEREGVKENQRLICLITGKNKFFSLKGVLEVLLKKLSIEKIKFRPATHPLYHPTRTAKIRWGGKKIGLIGEVHPKILANFGIEERVTAFDLDFDQLAKLAGVRQGYRPILPFPPIVEDLCFEFEKRVFVSSVLRAIRNTSKLIKRVELLDIYQDRKTFRIFYQHPRRTLRRKEIKKIREKIIQRLRKQFGAEVRQPRP